ncbi:carboxylate--amine ligase [Anaerococcus porci]|uniref:carboxylate--amine ligase n=1 Tax=Anaerococcus porci TaxID=2652269 RepID=UPI002A75786B|nr:carboxylate--amine ligase [Anaerococcus porci]MDY3005384.1 carboxylate--amine ligase [Anaerococcus porci]
MKNISREIIQKFKVSFVILGSDENAYGIARILNDNYGLISTLFCQEPLEATNNSKILDRKIINDFSNEDIFVKSLIEYAKKNKDKSLFLIACGDEYSKLLSNNKNVLIKYYKFNTPSTYLNEKLENKLDFYKTCEKMGIPYPNYKIINASNNLDKLDMKFPLILKPNNSISYVKLSFPNKYKVYTINNLSDLKETVKIIYDNGYDNDMIVQECIPGDNSQQASLNAYCDKNGKVRVMVYGQILISDPLPLRIGNNDAIYTKESNELYKFYKKILEELSYTGFVNIDLKYDSRDNLYKAFEMNLRLPQSHYFMEAGGVNVLDFYIRDLLDLGFEEDVYYHKDTNKIWLNAHPSLLKKYTDKKYRKTINKLLKNGYEFTLDNKYDFSIKRKLIYLRKKYASIKHYKEYFRVDK